MLITSWSPTISLWELDHFLLRVDLVLQRYGSPTILRMNVLQILEESLEDLFSADTESSISLNAEFWKNPLRFEVTITNPELHKFPEALNTTSSVVTTHLQVAHSPTMLTFNFM